LAEYFTKHHQTSHHKSVCPTILTPTNDPEYTTLFKTSTKPVTFEPQIKTLVSTKLLVKKLLQTPRFKTVTINTDTAKSAEKFLWQGCVRPTSKYMPNWQDKSPDK
jgi:hypothetical protein